MNDAQRDFEGFIATLEVPNEPTSGIEAIVHQTARTGSLLGFDFKIDLPGATKRLQERKIFDRHDGIHVLVEDMTRVLHQRFVHVINAGPNLCDASDERHASGFVAIRYVREGASFTPVQGIALCLGLARTPRTTLYMTDQNLVGQMAVSQALVDATCRV